MVCLPERSGTLSIEQSSRRGRLWAASGDDDPAHSGSPAIDPLGMVGHPSRIIRCVGDRSTLHLSTAAELKQRLEAATAGTPYLVYREPGRGQRILALEGSPAGIRRGAPPGSPPTRGGEGSRRPRRPAHPPRPRPPRARRP